jgi:outer membrane lipoprotein-sorting protein
VKLFVGNWLLKENFMNIKTMVALGCLACSINLSAAELTASQIADKNVAARGGVTAWRALSGLSMAGDMEAGGIQDVKLPFVLSMKRPNKSRLEITFADKTALQVYDGSKGWKYRPFLNREDAEPFTAAEAKSAAATEIDSPLMDYASKGTKLELLGQEKVEGKMAYKLRLSPKTRAPYLVWVDAASFLEAKVEGEPRKLDNRMHQVVVYYRDYKTVGGLTMPQILETAVEGVSQTHKIKVTSFKLNPPMNDGMFAQRALAPTEPRAN